MKARKITTLFLITAMLFTMSVITAGGQKEKKKRPESKPPQVNIEEVVKEILSDYDPSHITAEDATAIFKAFREARLPVGQELDAAIKKAGFDPELLNSLLPPGAAEGERDDKTGPPKDRENPPKKSTKVFVSLSKDFNTPQFTLTSSAVKDGELLETFLPERGNSDKVSFLPLRWKHVPAGTKSLAIVVYHYPDPEDETTADSSLMIWGIDPSVNKIDAGEYISEKWYVGMNKGPHMQPPKGESENAEMPSKEDEQTSEFRIAIFALADYPASLPKESTDEVDFVTFMEAIEDSTILGRADLVFEELAPPSVPDEN